MPLRARFAGRLARSFWSLSWRPSGQSGSSWPCSGRSGSSAHDRLKTASATRFLKLSARLSIALMAVALAGACRQDMHDQPKYRPLRGSELFDDRRSARPLVEGTVARGTLREDTAYFTGKTGGGFVSEIPVELTPALLARGRSQFEVFCAPCHGRTGRGDGMVVQRGFKKPSSYHVDRLRQMPIGYFYDVITIGFGAMSDYAAQVPPQDRWAIAAYVRALQLSQYAPASAVPAERRVELEESVAAAPAAVPGGHP